MQGGKRTLHNVVVNVGMSSLATRLCKLPMAHSGPLTTVQIPTDHCFSLWFQTSPFVPKLPFPFPLCRSHWVRLLQAHQLCPLRLHLCLRHSCIQNILHSHGKSNNAPCIPAHCPPSAVSRPGGCLSGRSSTCACILLTLYFPSEGFSMCHSPGRLWLCPHSCLQCWEGLWISTHVNLLPSQTSLPGRVSTGG